MISYCSAESPLGFHLWPSRKSADNNLHVGQTRDVTDHAFHIFGLNAVRIWSKNISSEVDIHAAKACEDLLNSQIVHWCTMYEKIRCKQMQATQRYRTLKGCDIDHGTTLIYISINYFSSHILFRILKRCN